jgi:hypothetical protein
MLVAMRRASAQPTAEVPAANDLRPHCLHSLPPRATRWLRDRGRAGLQCSPDRPRGAGAARSQGRRRFGNGARCCSNPTDRWSKRARRRKRKRPYFFRSHEPRRGHAVRAHGGIATARYRPQSCPGPGSRCFPDSQQIGAGEIVRRAKAGDRTAGRCVDMLYACSGGSRATQPSYSRLPAEFTLPAGSRSVSATFSTPPSSAQHSKPTPPYAKLMARIPSFLVTCPEPGLLGCTKLAEQWLGTII